MTLLRARIWKDAWMSRAILALGAVCALIKPRIGLLLWMALAAAVKGPIYRVRYVAIRWSTAFLGFLLLYRSVEGIRGCGFSLPDSGIRDPMITLAAIAVLSSLLGMTLRDPEVPKASPKSLAIQASDAGLVLLSIAAALLVADRIVTPLDFQIAYWILLGAGAYSLLSQLSFMRAVGPPPPWWAMIVGHSIALAYSAILFVPAGLWFKLPAALLILWILAKKTLVPMFRPSRSQWISGWIALLLPVVALTFLRAPLLSCLILLPTGLFAAWFLRFHLEKVIRIAQSKGDFDRIGIWKDALKLSLKRPVFGVGPGNYPAYARRYGDAYMYSSAPTRQWLAASSSAHNNYLQTAVQMGYAGLAAMVWLVGRAIRTSWSLFRNANNPFFRALAAGIGSSLAAQAAASVLGDYLLPCYQNDGYANISVTLYSWMMMGILASLDAGQRSWGAARRPEAPHPMMPVPHAGAAEPSVRLPLASLGKSLMPKLPWLISGILVDAGMSLWSHHRASERKRLEDLDSLVGKRLKRFAGRVGIYARDLTTGATYARCADDQFPAASLFKVFVMLGLIRRAEDGGLRLGDRLSVDRTGISGTGPGVVRYLGDHPEFSLMDCCRLMIVWSDDVATDLLLRMLTPAAVCRTLAELGFPRTRVAGDCTRMKYRMAGIDAQNATEENDALFLNRMKEGRLKEAGFADSTADGTVTTPREMGMLLEGLHRREIASPAACDNMIQMMTEATSISRSMIPRFLPEGLTIAHRAGGSWRVLADAGLVDLAGRPVVISIFTHHDPAEKGAADLIADVSRILYAWSRTLQARRS